MQDAVQNAELLVDPIDLPFHLCRIGKVCLVNPYLCSPCLQRLHVLNRLADWIIWWVILKPGRPLIAWWERGFIDQHDSGLNLCCQIFGQKQAHFSQPPDNEIYSSAAEGWGCSSCLLQTNGGIVLGPARDAAIGHYKVRRGG